MLQILLQVQQMSKLPTSDRYKGVWDALKRIPQREGGIKVTKIQALNGIPAAVVC